MVQIISLLILLTYLFLTNILSLQVFLEKGSFFLGWFILLFLLLLFMASATANRWLRPEVYPLFATVGVAVGICAMQLVRNICTNPEVRVTKENRAAGVLDNFEEGEKYSQHAVRKFVRNRTPQVMPSINKFFSDPNIPN